MKSSIYLGHTVYENGEIYGLSGKRISERLNHKGYPQVTLHFQGQNYSRRVHRIIAELFIQNPENKPQVNHKDRNRENYSIDNLEWCTAIENVRHSVANGGRYNFTRDNTGDNNGNRKLSTEKVLEIREIYSKGNHKQSQIARMYGVNPPIINKIIKRTAWNHI